MIRFCIVAIVSCFTLFICLARQQPTSHRDTETGLLNAYRKADQFYQDAERFAGRPGFTEEQEDALNKKALEGFRNIILRLKITGTYDSLAFFCYLKTGILEHYFGNITLAKEAYSASILSRERSPWLEDSLLFKPFLYKGSIFYMQDQYDSALQYYKKAEGIINRYKTVLTESERLYNTFGIIYLSTGNYKQSKNYFEKAIRVLQPANPYYEALLNNYQINLATALTNMEEWVTADSIYQHILPSHINTNEILHNSGLVSLNQGRYRKALSLFNRIKYQGARLIQIDNDIATAYYKLDRYDSALQYLQKALEVNKEFNHDRKNIAHGTTLKELGDLLSAGKKYEEAIKRYQQAILQFYPSYQETDPTKNPGTYTGIFSYINLFNTLNAKADAFNKKYLISGNKDELIAGLAAYRSAFQLIAYVEKTYDSDEARLFLNKIKYLVHNSPIDICLRLYDLTHEQNFLEEAYIFDQQNKAAVLALNIRENALKNETPGGKNIFDRQSMLRVAITRLTLNASLLTDSSGLKSINDIINDTEIRLSKIQDTINTDPLFTRYRSIDKIPATSSLRQNLLDDHTAIISYHLSAKELITFTISRKSFDCIRQAIDSNFFQQLNYFVGALHNVAGENKYVGHTVSGSLYRKLLLPVFKKLDGINRLVIIPDDELNYLPFEALLDTSQQYVLNSFAIQYQYSTALLSGHNPKNQPGTGMLGFAPFAGSGYTDLIENVKFNPLGNSLTEIENQPGRILVNDQATKQAFLEFANHYPVIHLATHASVNEQDPQRSFIVFYPGSADNHLYAREIYDLRLDSTKLVILTACETGSGRLVRGEGIMSLSRAFASAGCPNIITSLWKAEDRSTALIAQRLHHYLNRGYSRDNALQQAKIDFLNAPDIELRFKTPNYWSHLVLIDVYEPVTKKKHFFWWLAIASLVAMLTVLQVVKKNHPAL